MPIAKTSAQYSFNIRHSLLLNKIPRNANLCQAKTWKNLELRNLYRDSTMEVQIDEFDAFSMQGVFNLPYVSKISQTNWRQYKLVCCRQFVG